MPTLTIDLPEEAYRNAIALPVEERQRQVATFFATARPDTGPDAAARHRALFDSWAKEPESETDTDLETLQQALNANRIASGEVPLDMPPIGDGGKQQQ